MSPPLLIERFPHSTHVRLIGLGGASDTAIWKWASQQGHVLVTKERPASCCSAELIHHHMGEGVPLDDQPVARAGWTGMPRFIRCSISWKSPFCTSRAVTPKSTPGEPELGLERVMRWRGPVMESSSCLRVTPRPQG